MLISTFTNGHLYGKGVFTTIAVFDGIPLRWEKHWRRLTANAARLGIDFSEHSEESITASLAEAIAVSGIRDSRARITLVDETPSPIWSNDREGKTTLSIIIAEWRTVPEPFKLTLSPFPVNSRSPLAGVKSCNYLENLMAIDEAKNRGSHEGIRVNERGHVTSGCMANLFWLNGKDLYTPSLSTGCLPGTTREYVLENLDCREVEAGIDELRSAYAIYLTSAGLGIVAAAEFDGRKLSNPPNPITKLFTRN